jgi:hypothetical protein
MMGLSDWVTAVTICCKLAVGISALVVAISVIDILRVAVAIEAMMREQRARHKKKYMFGRMREHDARQDFDRELTQRLRRYPEHSRAWKE